MRKPDAMLVRMRSWDELVEALGSRYTVSAKTICRELKCSRTWFDSHVKPNVEHVYVSRGYGSHTKGADWARMLCKEGIIPTADSTWYDEAAYRSFVLSHAKAFARTKSVPLDRFVADPDTWIAEVASLRLQQNAAPMGERLVIEDEIEKLIRNALNPTGRKLLKAELKAHKRGGIGWVEQPISKVGDIRKWESVASMMDYGDTYEPIYRRLFACGAWKVELRMPDSNGKEGASVYYADDPDYLEPAMPESRVDTRVIVPWESYERL